jgi:hypothetical protein
MNFKDYKDYLTTAFPKAVRNVVKHPEESHRIDIEIKQPAQQFYQNWGFNCVTDCFAIAVPHSKQLQLDKWSRSDTSFEHWKMNVTCRAMYLCSEYVRWTP